MKSKKCPICGYDMNECQCIYSGSCHPSREIKKSVVHEHLYLLSKKQLKHVISLQKFHQVSYVDEKYSEALDNLKTKGTTTVFGIVTQQEKS